MMQDKNGKVQSVSLGEEFGVTSPYTVVGDNKAIEFIDGGAVTLTLKDGTTKPSTVLAGSRYSIEDCVVSIAFLGTANVG